MTETIGRPRGTPIDRCIAIMQQMDQETLRDFEIAVKYFAAGRRERETRNGKPENQAMLELGAAAAEGE